MDKKYVVGYFLWCEENCGAWNSWLYFFGKKSFSDCIKTFYYAAGILLGTYLTRKYWLPRIADYFKWPELISLFPND